MPHIIVEYSQNMGPDLDIPQILTDIHDALAANGVDKARIKTRAIPLLHSVVGTNEANDGHMAHLTLLLLEGRDIPTKQAYGKALHDVLAGAVRAEFPDAAVTLEVRDMVKDTYIL
jgi:5-carboxymethyl-2-hydroxymuconate isomerase